MTMTSRPVILTAIVFASLGAYVLRAQGPGGGPGAPAQLDPFVGVTTEGPVRPGLFTVKSTGVGMQPTVQAATAFLSSLTAEQRKASVFPVDGEEWRRWNNVHRAARAGVSLDDGQRARALELLKASLSAKGLELTQNVMRLNHTIAEITNNFTEYGEDLYNLVVFGEPSLGEPWGWQLEGHHLIINYFVLRDQVVMTPAFWGSEPVVAESGKYKGIAVLQDEQNKGLALMQSLDPEQQTRALIVAGEKTANNAQSQAYRDNLQLPYAGIKAEALTPKQRESLLDLIALYVGNMADGHARVKMAEVRGHLSDTHFGWIGGYGAGSVFYYRIHSPVILIEFDHQTPVALKGPRVPGRQHIHSVVRTPNGNDYGKDLLRQHYQQHGHAAQYGRVTAQ